MDKDKEPENIVIVAGNASRDLAQDIAEHLDVELRDSELSTFSDGEIKFELNGSVRGKDVFVVQSTDSNDHIMELLVMLDALKRASARRITAIIPYFGYARQDRKVKAGDPITAKLMADLLTTAGADRIVSLDMHSPQIQGFFDIPVDHIKASSEIADYYADEDNDNIVIVSPDAGSVKRTRDLAKKLGCELVIVDKRRPRPNEAEIVGVIGDVEGKDCIMVDDMIDTGGTIVNGAKELKRRGAKSVRAACTHAVLSGEAIDLIEESPIEELVCVDTIDMPEEKKIDKIKILSCKDLLGEAIKYIHQEKSLDENLPS